MASLARDIQLDANCGADLEAENPTVMQAYNGLASYQPMYHVGCLQDRSTGSYCFADAVTNASSPTSSYVYYLAVGVSLPSMTNPTCSECLHDTMALFGAAASNKSQPIAAVYADAAKMIDSNCGKDFVNMTISTSSSSSGSGSASRSAASTGLVGGGDGFGVLGAVALAVAVASALLR